MMKIETFVAAVNDMRTKQNAYFSTRSPYILQEAKKAEAVVDSMIKNYESAKIQLSLF